jgi:hypothetical protein
MVTRAWRAAIPKTISADLTIFTQRIDHNGTYACNLKGVRESAPKYDE